jgi:antitoxin YefM
MTVITYTHLRQNLASVMDEVVASKAPLIVTRRNAAPVVMISLEEWEGMEETLHLMKSPRNRKRLLASIERLNAGKAVEHEPYE